MCCDYECPVGYTNVHGSIGDTEEECCETTCEGFICSSGWTPKDMMEGIEGVGRNNIACCDEWCGDFPCPSGQRNVGDVLGTPDAGLCCEACAGSNCKDCGADPTMCAQCIPGFRLDPMSGTCEACGENDCSCYPGTRLDLGDGTCDACEAANCGTCCADKARCDSCLPGYELNATAGICSMPTCLGQNCKQCDADGVCLKCNEGFYVDVGRCKFCEAEGCTSCSKDPSECDSCKAGHGIDASGLCARCTAETECSSCSQNLSKCDGCRDGSRLDWFKGLCEPCFARNCRTCNQDLIRCDSCEPGFVGDKKTGQCLAKTPLPIEGRCEGLEGPFEFHAVGACGAKLHWLGCDEAGGGPSACYRAVMAEPKCQKDYFTYSERGDQNCGCKISQEDPVRVLEVSSADCYVIKNATAR